MPRRRPRQLSDPRCLGSELKHFFAAQDRQDASSRRTRGCVWRYLAWPKLAAQAVSAAAAAPTRAGSRGGSTRCDAQRRRPNSSGSARRSATLSYSLLVPQASITDQARHLGGLATMAKLRIPPGLGVCVAPADPANPSRPRKKVIAATAIDCRMAGPHGHERTTLARKDAQQAGVLQRL
jgi:hypothetical protein